MAREREFREDLYYRLNVFPVYLPPLRERKVRHSRELVEYFVQQFAASMDKSIRSIPPTTMRSLVQHHWPGNIRELQNYVARGVILSNDGVFEPGPSNASSIHWSPRFQTRRSKIKSVEKSCWPANVPIGSWAVRAAPRPNLA